MPSLQNPLRTYSSSATKASPRILGGLWSKSAIKVEYYWGLLALRSVTVSYNLWKTVAQWTPAELRMKPGQQILQPHNKGVSLSYWCACTPKQKASQFYWLCSTPCQPIVNGSALPFHGNQACTSDDIQSMELPSSPSNSHHSSQWIFER